MADIDTNTESHSAVPTRPVAFGGLALAAMVVVLGGIICVQARQLDWTLGGIYLGLFAAHGLGGLVCVLLCNPVVIERRMFPGPGTKNWDWIWTVVCSAILVAVVVVAVQDVNSRDGDPVPPGIGSARVRGGTVRYSRFARRGTALRQGWARIGYLHVERRVDQAGILHRFQPEGNRLPGVLSCPGSGR